MKYLNLNSINKKLILLVIFAVLPGLIILLYSGMEQRRHCIEDAKQSVFLLTHTIAESQKEVTRSTRQILSTLSLLPVIQAGDIRASSEVFQAILEQNPIYNNITLLDLNGEVVASGKNFTEINLADRKHVQEALAKKDFAVGEFIISRVGDPDPAFPFAYPVLDKQNHPKAILTITIKLSSFYRFYDVSSLPAKSFVAVTDHQGIRLFYYPPQDTTNPTGRVIKADSWERAHNAKDPGIFISTGSDGLRRIFAFEPVRLISEGDPYFYIWTGIPEDYVLAPANATLTRNLLLMVMAAVLALNLSWVFCKKLLISPIHSLVDLTRKFAEGNLESRNELIKNTDEFGALANAFHNMAETLSKNQTAKNALIKELEKAIAEIKTLQGILPICSICKKIRNDEGYYEQIEEYIHKHTGVDFSHTICTPCIKKHYPEQYDYIVSKSKKED